MMLTGENGSGPLHSAVGNGTEIFIFATADARAIVVAADADARGGSQSINDFVGIGGIADGVAEIPDRIVLGRYMEDGVKGLEIGMDIGNEESAHSWPMNESRMGGGAGGCGSSMFAHRLPQLSQFAKPRTSRGGHPLVSKDDHGGTAFGFVLDRGKGLVGLIEGERGDRGTKVDVARQ